MKVGELLNDRYLLLAELGRGSSGTVLKAKDTLLGSTVCVKILREGLANDEHVVERFKRELLLARRLSHPGICKAFDLQQVDDTTVFLVMEFVDGESLAERLNRDRLPMSPEEAVRIVYGAADAVGVANAQNIVHRDLKPGNILIRDDESIVVVDFGIATAGDMDKLTTPGLVLGSSRYISPERWLGEEALPPSDVWSLGIILYGCLTARLPFDGEGPFGAFEAMQKGPPDPPSLYNPDVGDRLQAIIKKALAYKKADRYPDAGAFARALEAIVDPSTKSLLRPDALTEGALAKAGLGEIPAPLDVRPTAPTDPGRAPDETLTADGMLPWQVSAPSTPPAAAATTPQIADPTPVLSGAPVLTSDTVIGPPPTDDTFIGPPPADDTVIGPPPQAPGHEDRTTGDEVLTEMDGANDLMDAGPTLLVREHRSNVESPPLVDDAMEDDELTQNLLRGQRNLRIAAAIGGVLLVLVLLVLALRGCGESEPDGVVDDAVAATADGQAALADASASEPAADPVGENDDPKDAGARDEKEPATPTDENPAPEADHPAADDGFDFASGDVDDASKRKEAGVAPKAEPASPAATKSSPSSARRTKTSSRKTKRSGKRSARAKPPSADDKKAASAAMRDVAAAIKAKGLLPGDASAVDAAFKALKKASRRKDYGAVVRLAEQAVAAVDATKIDRKLVDRKLTRFNRRYDAVTDANKKQKLDRAIAKIRAPFQRSDFAATNRALNQAFALF